MKEQIVTDEQYILVGRGYDMWILLSPEARHAANYL